MKNALIWPEQIRGTKYLPLLVKTLRTVWAEQVVILILIICYFLFNSECLDFQIPIFPDLTRAGTARQTVRSQPEPSIEPLIRSCEDLSVVNATKLLRCQPPKRQGYATTWRVWPRPMQTRLPTFCMDFFGVKGILHIIISDMTSSRLNTTTFRAVWTYFTNNSMALTNKSWSW